MKTTNLSFGYFRRRADGQTFALYFHDDKPIQAAGPLIDYDPTIPPTHFEAGSAPVVWANGWNLADFIAIGDRFHLTPTKPTRAMTAAELVAAGRATENN